MDIKAVIIATGFRERALPLVDKRPTPCFNIADRPIICHIMDYLRQRRIRDYELILHHLPRKIENVIGGGGNWGAKVNYRLVKKADEPFALLTPISKGWPEDQPILLAQGDFLPVLAESLDPEAPFFVFCKGEWTGWGLLPAGYLRSVDRQERLANVPRLFPKVAIMESEELLSTRSVADLKKNNDKILGGREREIAFPPSMKEIRKGVWIAPGAVICRDVTISPPIFVGDNCVIKGGVKLGPRVLIEKNCMVDINAQIEDALVCGNSYVGERLRVSNCVIDKNFLINIAVERVVDVEDGFVLSASNHLPFKKYLGRFLEICLGIFCLAISAPFLLLMRCFSPIESKEAILLPASAESKGWKTFRVYVFTKGVLRRLPMLLNIVRGEAHFVGLRERSSAEVKRLPRDWRNLYLNSLVGMITAGEVLLSEEANEDDIYACEAFYSVKRDFYYDLRLFLKWLKKSLIRNPFGRE